MFVEDCIGCKKSALEPLFIKENHFSFSQDHLKTNQLLQIQASPSATSDHKKITPTLAVNTFTAI